MKSYLHKLTLYNDWANQRIFDQFSQEEAKVPALCMRMLCHIVNTQLVWLNRIQGQSPPVKPWDEHPLEVCKKMHLQANEVLKHYMTSEVNLEQVVDYTNFAGVPFHNTIADILIHVFNHGTYHRAQIAQDMRKNGFEPVITDYIVFVR